MQEAYIVAGFRSAIGKAGNGRCRCYRPDDLAIDVSKQLLAAVPALDHKLVDDCSVACANPQSEHGLQISLLITIRHL